MMGSIFKIRIQKLFLITIILKVGSSYLGWYLGMQWSLGFWIPLSIMAAYIVLGLKREDRDVSDEKFADSCYYLGFIFTITSIIFSLFDLPDIGTKIQDIAVRFGAAMVSTVAGLAVRVYLVSFNKDVGDAVREAEYSIIETSQRFREQLVLAYERLSDFQSQVENGTKGAVERVNLQVESLSRNHADKLSGFFEELAGKNQAAFTSALDEVKKASLRLSASVDDYSLGMRSNLGSIEAKVTAFTDAVSERLKTTTFPDDYFAKQLEPPLAQLNTATNAVAGQVLTTATEVGAATTALAAALRKLQSKSAAIESSMDAAMRLTAQQQSVLDTSQSQVSVLEKLGATLDGFGALLGSTVAKLDETNASAQALAGRIDAVVISEGTTRQQLEGSFAKFVEQLGANAVSTDALTKRVAESVAQSNEASQKLSDKSMLDADLADKLAATTALTSQVIQKLDAIATTGSEQAQASVSLGEKGVAAMAKLDGTLEQLRALVQDLSRMEATRRPGAFDIRDVAQPVNRSDGLTPLANDVLEAVPVVPTNGLVEREPQGSPASISTPVVS
jgi:chromosome segregation ATPase